MAPWFRGSIEALTLAELDAYAAAGAKPLRSDCGVAIHFVAPAANLSAAGYEYRIFGTGAVPTRPGERHDAFNALCWLAFPELKRACNALHVAALAQAPATPGARRGPLRDALTLLDESGVIVLCAAPLLGDLLGRREWKALFREHRAEVAHAMRFLVCGHALYEKLLAPYPGITGRALLIPAPVALLDQAFEVQRQFADEGAARLLRAGVSAAQTVPLPIAGIPGWDPRNDAPDFYDDTSVFRPLNPATTAGSDSTSAQSASAPAPVSSSGEP